MFGFGREEMFAEAREEVSFERSLIEDMYLMDALDTADYMWSLTFDSANPGQQIIITDNTAPASMDSIADNWPQFSFGQFVDDVMSSHEAAEQALSDTIYDIASEIQMIHAEMQQEKAMVSILDFIF